MTRSYGLKKTRMPTSRTGHVAKPVATLFSRSVNTASFSILLAINFITPTIVPIYFRNAHLPPALRHHSTVNISDRASILLASCPLIAPPG
jgi:hypothetical protein